MRWAGVVGLVALGALDTVVRPPVATARAVAVSIAIMIDRDDER
jgi:hypothetical protein